jgi:hypothetical protein
VDPDVRSIDALLLGVAEGADRFNADVEKLLQQTRARAPWTPLTIPLTGHDY